MKTVLLAGCMLSLGAAAPAGLHHDETGCDLKVIEPAWICDACDSLHDAGGVCTVCNRELRAVGVCVKIACECSCGRRASEPTQCCGRWMNETRVRALVVFTCEGCGAVGQREADCPAEFCRRAGLRLRRACAASGAWPHGESPD